MHPGKKEEAKRALEAKELEECTFAPNIHIRANPERKVIELNPKPRAQKTVTEELPVQETEEVQPGAAAARLYKMRKAQKNKTDKAKEDYEYEKQAEECTFAPNIKPKQARKKAAPQEKTERQLKAEQKQMERL